MRHNNMLLFVLLLGACAKKIPFYIYENAHNLDSIIQTQDSCIVIDNDRTIYEKGVDKLTTNPFWGNESLSANQVKKTKRNYDYSFVNKSCPNPIIISRDIKVSGIVYPDTCEESVYAGSVYTGSTTYSYGHGSANMIGNSAFGSYSGVSNTYVNSIPIFNKHRYACTRENYVTEIEFYHDSDYVGKIQSKYWSTEDTDYVIDAFTEEFLKILQNGAKQKSNTSKM